MSQQEIGIKLRADTREAVKSVKDLERQVQGLGDMSNKGKEDNGFLSEKDVKQFRKMSQEADKVYRDFYERYNKIQRDFETKKKELESAMKRSAGQSTIDQLKREVAELEARKKILSSQSSTMDRLHSQAGQHQQDIGGMKTGNAFTSVLGQIGRQAITMTTAMLSFQKLFSSARQGMQLVKDEEAYMMGLGTRTGGYEGDFQKAREEAYATGKPYGYTASESMQAADALVRIGGATSKENMWKNTHDLQWGARATGLDVGELAVSGGTLQKYGALQDGEMRKFANILTGAIKESGMAGRDSEMLDAIDGLASQVASGQVSLSQEELKNMIGLQSAIGSVEQGWKGERGASLLSQMDGVVKHSQDQRLNLLLGWGTDFRGTDGLAELERLKDQGITDPEVRQRIAKNIRGIAGGDKNYQALMLKDIFGISMQEADRLLEDDMGEIWTDPNLGKELEGKGHDINSKSMEEVLGSEAMRRKSIDVRNEEMKRSAGEKIDAVWRPIQDKFFDMPTWAQWGSLGGLATGGSIAAGKIGSWGLGALKSSLGTTIGTGAAGKSAGAGILSKIGGLGTAGATAFKSADAWLKAGSTAAQGVKALPIAGAVVSGGLEVASAKKKGDSTGKAIFKGIMSAAGGVGGGLLGGLAGGGVASVAVGTAGAVAGSKGGALLGDKIWDAGAAVGGRVKDFFTGGKEVKSKTIDEEKISKATTENLTVQKGLLTTEEKHISTEAELLDLERDNIENFDKSISLMNNVLTRHSNSLGGGGGLFSRLFSKGDSEQLSYGNITTGNNAELRNKKLTEQTNLTAKQIDDWIDSKVGSWEKKTGTTSLLRGKGATFLKAAQESGLDPAYLVAHAAHETAWGTSAIARKKGNFYGIGAFDASPMASAYSYSNTDAGIIEGAKWISKNYTQKGQDTLHQMVNNNGVHEYATDKLWDEKIANIMAGAPVSPLSASSNSSAQTIKVEVGGQISGMTPENSNNIAKAIITNAVKTSGVNLAFEFRQGVGGNRA